MEKELNIGFGFQAIKTEQFAMFDANYVQKEDIILSTKFEIKIHHTDRRLAVFLEAHYLQAEKVLLKIVVSCHFLVTEQSWENLINKEESSIVFPKGLLAHLAMLTVGTARGILCAKTEGTLFSTFILPTLNVDEIMNEDAKFPLEANDK